MSESPHSDYIVFADESGDHGLVSVDLPFPVFALIFVIMRKDDYLNQVVITFENLKFLIWGHDQVIFHESDIRKERGKTEDDELELELLRILANQSSWGYRSVDFSKANFRHRFLDKRSNCSGLQLADLVARPIALRTLRPLQPNRAFDILAPKIYERKRFPLKTRGTGIIQCPCVDRKKPKPLNFRYIQ